MQKSVYLTKPKEVIKGVAGSSALAAPAIAAERVEIAMVATWPRDFPGLGTGAQRFAQKLSDVSDGRIQVTYYAAGERVGAFDSFDEVASGNAQAYHAADYYWKGKHPGWAYFTAVPFGLTYGEMKSWLHWMGVKSFMMNLLESLALNVFRWVTQACNGAVGLIKKSTLVMTLRG